MNQSRSDSANRLITEFNLVLMAFYNFEARGDEGDYVIRIFTVRGFMRNGKDFFIILSLKTATGTIIGADRPLIFTHRCRFVFRLYYEAARSPIVVFVGVQLMICRFIYIGATSRWNY